MTQPTSTKRRWRWFYWDQLAVVDDDTGEAFALGDKGWRPVNSAGVEWDGRPLTEEAARSAFRSSLAKFGDPPPTLATAWAMSRVAAKYNVPDLASMTEEHEKQALAEIKTYHFPAPKLLQ